MKNFGFILKDNNQSKILDLFEETFNENDQWNKIDISKPLQRMIQPKDDRDLRLLEKSAQGTNYYFHRLQNNLEEIIDNHIKINHNDISKKMEDFLIAKK